MKRIRSAAAVLIVLALLCGAFTLPVAAADIRAIDAKAFAAEVLRLVNEERVKAGLAQLRGGPASLEAAANLRAQEIAVSFSHTRPNGSSCFTALAEHGVAYAACGENIASGNGTPAQVMAGWMNSPGHRANILGNFNRAAVGVYEKNGRIHWVQMFILERGGGAVTTTRAGTTVTPATGATPATAGAGANTKITAALPAWLQWILRVGFFGWIWMK